MIKLHIFRYHSDMSRRNINQVIRIILPWPRERHMPNEKCIYSPIYAIFIWHMPYDAGICLVMAHLSNGSMFRTSHRSPSIIYSILNKLLKEICGCSKHGPVWKMGHYPMHFAICILHCEVSLGVEKHENLMSRHINYMKLCRKRALSRI